MEIFPVSLFLFYLTYISDEFIVKVKAILKSEPKCPAKTDLVFSLDNTAAKKTPE